MTDHDRIVQIFENFRLWKPYAINDILALFPA